MRSDPTAARAAAIRSRLGRAVDADRGYSTAELLGNAALAIGALGAIWLAIGETGEQVVAWVGDQLMSGGG